jgi:hypothetical protein
VMTAAALGVDQAVDIREEGGLIVIKAITSEAYDLNALLDQMRPETFPEGSDFLAGPAVAKPGDVAKTAHPVQPFASLHLPGACPLG